MNFLGAIHLERKEYTQAHSFFLNALRLAEKTQIPDISWSAHSGLAGTFEGLNDYPNSVEHFKKAIESIEAIRGKLLIQQQKSEFLEDKIGIYESLVDLLVRLYENNPDTDCAEEAFTVLEKSKARAFLDSLLEARIDLEQDLAEPYRTRLRDITNRINGIQTRISDFGLNSEERSRLQKRLVDTEAEYDTLILELRRDHLDYANLVSPEIIGVSDIQHLLGMQNSAVVSYLLGEKHALVFLVTKDRFKIKRISDVQSLKKSVRAFIGLFSRKPGRSFLGREAGLKLYRDLVQPLEADLGDVEHLIIVPDGILHYLPFETLVMPNSRNETKGGQNLYLIERYRVSYAPSVSSLIHIIDREEKSFPSKDILGFANPEFPDSYSKPLAAGDFPSEFMGTYFQDLGFGLLPLPHSERELRAISKHIEKKSRDFFTGKEADEERLKSLDLSDYRIIHFATHGFLDEQVGERSSLLFALDRDPTEDGFLMAREIYNLKMNAELVVLSACQTAKGELDRGEGVTGLARAFIYAGADSVVVSLWNINDKSSADFMEHFYDFLSEGNNKSAALRRAKIRMIQSDNNHPYHWGAFILIGEFDSSIPLSDR
jgi:CHAT domain-containing protein